jgi:hypothetical protein
MKKRNLWPLLFIGLFTFTLGMIIWTISSAVKTPVHEDKTFLDSYQNVDKNFNEMLEQNEVFKQKYQFSIKINQQSFGLTTEDIFYSRRVLEERSLHKDLLKKGANTIVISIMNKNGQYVKDATIQFRVTKATNNKADMNFSNDNVTADVFESLVNIPIQGNWNITGTVSTPDGSKGYFYIKTNAL